ncbi:MAG: helix-turn-helix transcriptional regulator [bacterium]
MLGDKIKYFRIKRGLTQYQLAKKAGLYPTMYGKIEQNLSADPTIWSIIKIADALNVSLDELVGRKFKKKNVLSLPLNPRLR